MSHIFISYSSENREYAFNLKNKLQDEGFDVWIDNENLSASDNWWNAITNAIKNASAFIVIMTPASFASKWVQREVFIAEKWDKPTFPLLLEGENFEIYVATQFLDVRDQELPSDSFFKDLESVVPRKSHGKGTDITPEAISLALLLESVDKRKRDNSDSQPNIMIYIVVLVLIVSLTLVALFSIVSANSRPDDPIPLETTVEFGIKRANGIPIWAAPEQDLERPIIVFQGAELVGYAKSDVNNWYLVLIPGRETYGWVLGEDVYIESGDERNLPYYDSLDNAETRFPIEE